MATDNKTVIEKAANNMIDLATQVNDYALSTTEQVFDASFNIANKSLDITSKIVRKGLEVSASQQEFAFEILGGLKKRIFKNQKQ